MISRMVIAPRHVPVHRRSGTGMIGVLIMLLAPSGCGDGLGQPNSSAAIKQVAGYTGIVLPSSAADVRVSEISWMVQWVYVRFDIPSKEFAALVARTPRMPQATEMHPDQELLSNMAVVGAKLTWWQMKDLNQPIGGRKSGRVKTASGHLEWTMKVCVGRISDQVSRVYVVHTEEPVQ